MIWLLVAAGLLVVAAVVAVFAWALCAAAANADDLVERARDMEVSGPMTKDR